MTEGRLSAPIANAAQRSVITDEEAERFLTNGFLVIRNAIANPELAFSGAKQRSSFKGRSTTRSSTLSQRTVSIARTRYRGEPFRRGSST